MSKHQHTPYVMTASIPLIMRLARTYIFPRWRSLASRDVGLKKCGQDCNEQQRPAKIRFARTMFDHD